MSRLRFLVAALGGLLLTSMGVHAITGAVLTPEGIPVEGALVTTADGAATVTTNAQGRFSFPEVSPPVVLEAHHPRFGPRRVEVADGDTGPVEIVLTPKQAVYEEIVISASRGRERVGPTSIAVSEIEPATAPDPPTTLTEALEGVPGVAANGQGGIFQTYSIRGVSRQRVQTRVAGAPIVGERRAGVSASFLDPLLMQEIEVLRGPSSTLFGSGALGGAVHVVPRRYSETEVALGWHSQGDGTYLVAGTGGEGWSLGLAWRRADNAEAADGTEVNDHFEQVSGSLLRSWEGAGGTAWQLSLVPSWGEDIGKGNERFPVEVTTYPRERHLVARLLALTPGGIRWSIFAHPNDLTTRDDTPGAVALVDNQAFDYGTEVDRDWAIGDALTLTAGVDVFGRAGVRADERRFRVTAGRRELVETFRTLDDAQLLNAGAFVLARRAWGRATVSGGARGSWERQENGGEAISDEALSGFVGVAVPFATSWEVSANAGTGLRFPSLSERFFSGTTGRGEVVGNPDLAPERSWNLDVGGRWLGARGFAGLTLFRHEIDDYVERVRIGPDRLAFVNLTSGTIDGVEIEGYWAPTPAWTLSAAGHWMEGEADDGTPLADVPVPRLELAAARALGPGRARLVWEHRWEKDDPGPSEEAIGAADLVSLALTWPLPRGLEARLAGENLLDELYFSSADDRVPPAPGRGVSLGLRWSR